MKTEAAERMRQKLENRLLPKLRVSVSCACVHARAGSASAIADGVSSCSEYGRAGVAKRASAESLPIGPWHLPQ